MPAPLFLLCINALYSNSELPLSLPFSNVTAVMSRGARLWDGTVKTAKCTMYVGAGSAMGAGLFIVPQIYKGLKESLTGFVTPPTFSPHTGGLFMLVGAGLGGLYYYKSGNNLSDLAQKNKELQDIIQQAQGALKANQLDVQEHNHLPTYIANVVVAGNIAGEQVKQQGALLDKLRVALAQNKAKEDGNDIVIDTNDDLGIAAKLIAAACAHRYGALNAAQDEINVLQQGNAKLQGQVITYEEIQAELQKNQDRLQAELEETKTQVKETENKVDMGLYYQALMGAMANQNDVLQNKIILAQIRKDDSLVAMYTEELVNLISTQDAVNEKYKLLGFTPASLLTVIQNYGSLALTSRSAIVDSTSSHPRIQKLPTPRSSSLQASAPQAPASSDAE